MMNFVSGPRRPVKELSVPAATWANRQLKGEWHPDAPAAKVANRHDAYMCRRADRADQLVVLYWLLG